MPLPGYLAVVLSICTVSVVLPGMRPDYADMRGWVVVGKDSAELVMATTCHQDTPAIESRVCDMMPHARMDSMRAGRRLRVAPGAMFAIHFVSRPSRGVNGLQNETASYFHRFVTDDMTWYAPEKPGLYPLIVDANWPDRSGARQRFLFEVVEGAKSGAIDAMPDTTAKRLLLRTILASNNGRVYRDAADTAMRMVRLTYRPPDSLQWRTYDEDLLRVLHARPATNDDEDPTDISVIHLYTAGDTLVGRYSIGDARRCGPKPFLGGATTYEMRALRTATGWTRPTVLLTGIGDSFGCGRNK